MPICAFFHESFSCQTSHKFHGVLCYVASVSWQRQVLVLNKLIWPMRIPFTVKPAVCKEICWKPLEGNIIASAKRRFNR